MTVGAAAAERSDAPPVLPGVASLALERVLGGARRPAEVLGGGGPAVWIEGPGGVLVVTTGPAVRLPNGIHAAGGDAFWGIGAGDPASVGGGEVRAGSLAVRAVRWWDPVPAMAATTPGRLRGRIAELAAEVPGEEDHGLAGSLARGDATAATEAARRWIGLGDGLTPRGDDLVAGTLAAFLLVGRALGDGTVPALVGGVAGPLLDHAATATTAFSAALLANAVRGEVAAPAGDLLRVLTGEGSVGPVAAGLLAVGHSSGRALAAGILAGARAAMERRLRWIT